MNNGKLCQASAAFGGGHVFFGLARRPHGGVVLGQADRQIGVDGLQRVKAGDMGAELVVDGCRGLENVADPGGMVADEVALADDDEGLVECHPVLDPVAQGVGHDGGVLAEPIAMSGLDQPPSVNKAAGRSQWKRVTNGSMPAASSRPRGGRRNACRHC